MQKREAHDPESAASSGAVATPRVSGEVTTGSQIGEPVVPDSSTRPAQLAEEPSVVSEPTDTLLSAGKPADKWELLLEDRLAVVDERLRELDARLGVLERKKTSDLPEPRQKSWLWLAFLVALVVAFQLLTRLR